MSTPHYYDADVYCENCVPETAKPDEVMPGYFAEADHPEHCSVCEEMLDTGLTNDGLLAVEQAIQEYLEKGWGRGEIVLQWAERWLPEMVEDVKARMANSTSKAGTPEDKAAIVTDGGKE